MLSAAKKLRCWQAGGNNTSVTCIISKWDKGEKFGKAGQIKYGKLDGHFFGRHQREGELL